MLFFDGLVLPEPINDDFGLDQLSITNIMLSDSKNWFGQHNFGHLFYKWSMDLEKDNAYFVKNVYHMS